MSESRRVDELLAAPGSVLSDLVRGARRREQLDRQLREFLDRPLADHVHVASVRDGLLVLAADAPVWGHRIRYLTPAIVERMSRIEPGLERARIIVRPTRDPTAEDPPPRRASLSRRTASLLETVASTCDNPGLARSLARLGATRR